MWGPCGLTLTSAQNRSSLDD